MYCLPSGIYFQQQQIEVLIGICQAVHDSHRFNNLSFIYLIINGMGQAAHAVQLIISEIIKTTNGGLNWILQATYAYGLILTNVFYRESKLDVLRVESFTKQLISGIQLDLPIKHSNTMVLTIYFVSDENWTVGEAIYRFIKTTNGGINWMSSNYMSEAQSFNCFIDYLSIYQVPLSMGG